ncbi:tRNA preQ1(34) S-adenosylmethionine ribosyltransferase-isomerase QueA [Dongia rigui]|uniref:S-adenosylmethionine:tRNA ribosyltransferase-isomerase n=1 Tax=Dongia rigui TaxID=940149 RepID=A0ABU5DWY4_9PROT|nr:tRNA preQ1(34) S-adenosylmethionine ribosyltransferase-isomerase QueA [Dongia rigui]MDY0871430.1 tRNA preQ1(34) S-adenosylmethionine ribosyltransferase-isomerase QueA [Dongia rigui]
MRLSDFDFDLPPDRIALHPLEPREAARLLHVQEGGFSDRIVRDLPDLLREGDVLVSNDTKVIPAQLEGRRGEARIEVTLLTQIPGENTVNWWAFARPGKKLRLGERVEFAPDFAATVREKADDGQIRLDFGMDEPTFRAGLARHGWMPLPPYIRKSRAVERRDDTDYQTIFATREGAVAAPTAGLHFTPDLLARLKAKGVEQQRVTLHVGAGTFLPVKVDDVSQHKMHAEYGEIVPETAAAINRAKAEGRRVIAIGTTSLRLLESAAQDGRLLPFAASTDIFITPGFRFQIADMLMTNFHLPKSTLFMLVCAFAGEARMKAAYEHAIGSGYRFFSYGDASLLERAS